jgi:alcohol dehydrogenase class IV
VAGILTNGGEALDYMEVIGKGKKITRPAMPWIAVPTTAGTGAEVTKNAVIGSPEKKFKASIRSEHLLARVALIDAELHVGTPKQVTAASGMDALCQCIEAYVSKGANAMSDAIADCGAVSIIRSLRIAFEDGAALSAREDMAFGALCSGIALANAGLGAVHGFAAPIGANFPVPHGVVCARLLPGVIAANANALRGESVDHPSFNKYESLGVLLRVKGYAKSTSDAADYGRMLAVYVMSLVRDFAIPPLSEFGMREEHVPAMVDLAKKASSMRYNPVVLADDVLANILRSAL